MKRKKISLTSISFKILAMILVLALLTLTVVFIVFRAQIPLYATIISALITLGLVGVTYLICSNRIIVDSKNKYLVIQNLRPRKLKFKDIIEIKVDTSFSINPRKFCFIVFYLQSKDMIKISGYSSMLKKDGVRKSEQLVKQLKEIMTIN